MITITQEPVNIGPIPVDVCRVPETGSTLVVIVLGLLMMAIALRMRRESR